MKRASYLLLCLFPAAAALAGGSNYGIAPGARPDFTGKVSEWRVPTPKKDGKKIDAIQLIRAKTGLGLKEAKEIVDRLG